MDEYDYKIILDSEILANDVRSNANSATTLLVFLVHVISKMI